MTERASADATDRPRRPTISDVAAAARVSRSTVSYALSGGESVRADTKARILEVAARLGYRPSGLARAVRLGSSRVIALCSPTPRCSIGNCDICDRFLGRLVARSMAAAASFECDLMLLGDLTPAGSRRLPVDGFVVVDIGSSTTARAISVSDVPQPVAFIQCEDPHIDGTIQRDQVERAVAAAIDAVVAASFPYV